MENNYAQEGEAQKFLALTNYIYGISDHCYNRCLVDFQTKDLNVMERDCAVACIQKQMTIYADMQR